jgi:serine/threonine protein kinase
LRLVGGEEPPPTRRDLPAGSGVQRASRDAPPESLEPAPPEPRLHPFVEAAEPDDPRGPVLVSGTVIDDRYQIVQIADEGATARVYKAVQLKLRRHVALKLVYIRLAEPDVRLRVQNEVESLSAIHNRHVVGIIDTGQSGDWLYIVEDWLHGTTLRTLLTERGRLPREEALGLAIQMASGLSATHEAGITHRDLKPENIFVTETGEVKLLDFGLSKFRDAVNQTRQGLVLCTPAYTAPERFKNIPKHMRDDPRGDVFSFGVILYEMLRGAHPYKQPGAKPSVQKLILLMSIHDPPVLSSEPLELWELIASTLDRDLGKRPASAAVVRDQLIRIHKALTTPAPQTPVPNRLDALRSLRRRVWPSLALGLGVGISAGPSTYGTQALLRTLSTRAQPEPEGSSSIAVPYRPVPESAPVPSLVPGSEPAGTSAVRSSAGVTASSSPLPRATARSAASALAAPAAVRKPAPAPKPPKSPAQDDPLSAIPDEPLFSKRLDGQR